MRARLPLLTVAAALLLAGCAGGGPAPDDTHFRLVAQAPAPLASPALDGALLVQQFTADGVIAQRPLVWAAADAPQALHQYHYHFWADPPTVMLQNLVATVLREAHVARLVVVPDHGVAARFVLVGRIERLEQLLGEAPTVSVVLELGVLDERTGTLVLLEHYARERPVVGTGVAAAVPAMNEAITDILAGFVADLAAR